MYYLQYLSYKLVNVFELFNMQFTLRYAMINNSGVNILSETKLFPVGIIIFIILLLCLKTVLLYIYWFSPKYFREIVQLQVQ